MAIGSVDLVQTLQPARPASQPQPVSVPPDDRREAADRVGEASDRERRPSPPEPGKGRLVDRSA